MTTTQIINKEIRGRNLIDLVKAKIEDPDQFFSIKLEITPIDEDDIKKKEVYEYDKNVD